MNKKKRALIIGVALCILFVIILSALLFSIHTHSHNCSGEDCKICLQLEQYRQSIKSIVLDIVIALNLSTLLCLFYATIRKLALTIKRNTLVDLRVKLSN